MHYSVYTEGQVNAEVKAIKRLAEGINDVSGIVCGDIVAEGLIRSKQSLTQRDRGEVAHAAYHVLRGNPVEYFSGKGL